MWRFARFGLLGRRWAHCGGNRLNWSPHDDIWCDDGDGLNCDVDVGGLV